MMKMNKSILTLLLAAIVGGAVALGGYKVFFEEKGYETFEKSQRYFLSNYLSDTSGSSKLPESLCFVMAADLTRPAVVHVKTFFSPKDIGQQFNPQMDPFLRDFFGDGFGGQIPQQTEPKEASGSGVIISQDGYIVTNYHVIENADKIEVILEDKRSYTAKLIGKDPSTDLALLKVGESNLPFVKLGDSDKLKIGEWVLAVGNPYDLTSTVTAGIVSAKTRNINILRGKENFAIESFIQTDAAVNPGNSGGALVNLKGELVGVNTAIASPTGSYSGYSFAVPVGIVKKVMDDLLKYGEVQRGLLGISIQDLTSDLAKEKGIKDLNGVYVGGVNEKGAAEEAGIKTGDVILKIDGHDISNTSALQEAIGRHRPGDKVGITLLRGDKTLELVATLKNKMGNTDVVKLDDRKFLASLGAEFAEVEAGEKKKLKLQGGVKVIKLKEGKLRSAGMKEGFIITQINKVKIKNLDELAIQLEKPRKGGILLEGVYPNGQNEFYAIGN
jgi:serine protease Do